MSHHRLALPGDIARIGDITIEDSNEVECVSVPSLTETRDHITAVRRRIADLPDNTKNMNTIGIVLSYDLYGLPKEDIAIATGLPLEQISIIQSLDAYNEMRDGITVALKEHTENQVRDVFAKASYDAAVRITELAKQRRPDIALSASKEVLDRSGHTVQQTVLNKHTFEDPLRIEIVTRDVSKPVPMVDVTPVRIDEDDK